MSNTDTIWKLHDPVCRFIRREDESQRRVGGAAQNVNLEDPKTTESQWEVEEGIQTVNLDKTTTNRRVRGRWKMFFKISSNNQQQQESQIEDGENVNLKIQQNHQVGGAALINLKYF